MTSMENHKLREDNLSKLKSFERENISFDILSRAAFIINASRTQPVMTVANGVVHCKFPNFELDIKETNFVLIHRNGREEPIPAESRDIIHKIKLLTA